MHRYNAEGVEGLKDLPRLGRKPLLGEEQLSELDKLVETPPNPVKDGVVRWRCSDLVRVVERRFGVLVSEDTIARTLRALGFSHITARPKHPEQKKGAIERFKKNSRASLKGR